MRVTVKRALCPSLTVADAALIVTAGNGPGVAVGVAVTVAVAVGVGVGVASAHSGRLSPARSLFPTFSSAGGAQLHLFPETHSTERPDRLAGSGPVRPLRSTLTSHSAAFVPSPSGRPPRQLVLGAG